MKLITLLLLLSLSTVAFSQTMESYTASNGITYNVGDDIVLGRGSGQNGMFVYLLMGGIYESSVPSIPSSYSGLKATVKKIKQQKNMQNRLVFVVHVKAPMSVASFNLFIEDAIATCEIADCKKKDVAPVTIVNTPSRFDELKKLKELLDAGAITEEEYKTEKEKLLK